MRSSAGLRGSVCDRQSKSTCSVSFMKHEWVKPQQRQPGTSLAVSLLLAKKEVIPSSSSGFRLTLWTLDPFNTLRM